MTDVFHLDALLRDDHFSMNIMLFAYTKFVTQKASYASCQSVFFSIKINQLLIETLIESKKIVSEVSVLFLTVGVKTEI